MKQIAILSYDIMFDPSQAWTSGSQFEANLTDFFGAHGFEARIVEARGGTGRRVIFLSPINEVISESSVKQPASASTVMQIKKIATTPPSDSFKNFSRKSVHEHMQSPEKLEFGDNRLRLRKKVRMP